MAGTFKTVIDVGPDHREQARAIDRVFQEAIAPATVNFDFDNIREAAAAIPGGAVVKTVRGWGLQEYAPIMVMALSLKEAVRQALPEAFADASFWTTIEAEFARAFTGLAEQDGAAGLAYYDEGPEHTSFYRDLFFALQDEEVGAGVYAIAFCVDATIGLDRARVGALREADVAPFALRLNAIVVRQETQPAA